MSRDIVRPGATIEELVRVNGLTPQDAEEVLTFSRFLRDSPPPGSIPNVAMKCPGWIPYCLGTGPPPDEGYEQEHPTAWTLGA